MQPAAWRPSREDWRAMLLVLLIPTLLALVQLVPALKADPLYYTARIAADSRAGAWPGVPYIDPNNGFQTQALGRRAVFDWLDGEIPWWNPYSGVGMPLAGEYQPAAFFPLTLLLALPRGMVLLQWSLEVLAGLGTFALLRQLGTGRTASVAGAIVYSLNGTLAWFAHAPASVVPSLPWMLLGIERALQSAASRRPHGWRTFAAALALSLLAGFPEVAYLDGLLALGWFGVRAWQAPSSVRLGFVARVIAGGMAGLAIASPQIVAFLTYLPDAYLAGHAGNLDGSVLPLVSIIASLFAPYAFGPIFAFQGDWPLLAWHWGAIGGYASAAVVAAAIAGCIERRDALRIFLAAWIVTVLGRTFGLEPFMSAWNLVPGITLTAFPRYAQPTWELALTLLAAFAVDALGRASASRTRVVVLVVLVSAGACAMLAYWLHFWTEIAPHRRLRNSSLVAMAWAIATLIAGVALYGSTSGRRRQTWLAALLIVDSMLLFAVPIVSSPRGGHLEVRGVQFLQANLGLQRFFTLGPIQPNYGAYFGVASVNHNYLPVPRRWTEFVQARLARDLRDPVVFDGLQDDGTELRANLRAYEEIGVRFVATSLSHDPFIGVPGVHLVHRDGFESIYELEGSKPYFEALGTRCEIRATERTHARVRCDAPGQIVRRELFFSGWRATVDDRETPITEHGPLFQAVAVPAGVSEIRFRFAPPYIGWAWLAMGLGLAALAAPWLLLLRRKHQ